MITRLILAGAMALGLQAAAPGAAHAATACNLANPDVTDRVTGVTACNVADTITNDPASAAGLAGVNGEGFFGVSNWMFDHRANFDGADEGANTLGFSLGAGSDEESGSWSFSNLSGVGQVMLLFKDGNNANPSVIVTYLVDLALGMGDYLTPFFNGDTLTSGAKEISHISVYYTQGDATPIPLPAAAWMLLGGLGGIGLLARRRRAA